jgi:hypothetical protein
MRRLLGPVLALLIVLGGAGLTSCRPQEARAEVTRADVRALGPGDTLQIITHYRVSLTQAGGVPDGVSVRVALDSAGSPILHQHRVTDSADTARINAANRYGTLRGSSCVAVSRRGLSSTERCVPWTDRKSVVAGVEQMRTLGREWAVMYCADQHTAWQSERSG